MKKQTSLFLIFFWLFWLSSIFSPSIASSRRLALIIGNRSYQHITKLTNPVNDAIDLGKTLENLKFDVVIETDLNWQQMSEVIGAFGDKLDQEDVGLFYFSGHGVQVNGRNYLLPIDVKLKKAASMRYMAIDINRVLTEMTNAENKLNIIIMDACRGNPFPARFRDISNNLAKIVAPRGAMIAYSTSPGERASDGNGKNGLYTGELIEVLKMSGLRLIDIFMQVRNNVILKSNQTQTPWESTCLRQPFYFSGTAAPTIPSAPAIPELSSTKQIYKNRLIKFKLASGERFAMEMVWVAKGCYQMGCGPWNSPCDEDETPQHKVCLSGFWMSKYEITNQQYLGFLNSVKKTKNKNEKWIITRSRDMHSKIYSGINGFTVNAKYQHYPVSSVTWYGAKKFATWLSRDNWRFDLPTEAQWEYAARSCGHKQRYAGGDNIKDFAWYAHNSKQNETVRAVGLKKPNSIGLYDMSGNLWEWCLDQFEKDAYRGHTLNDPIENHTSKPSIKVFRGGSYRYEAHRSRTTNRGGVDMKQTSYDLGFRLVMTEKP